MGQANFSGRTFLENDRLLQTEISQVGKVVSYAHIFKEMSREAKIRLHFAKSTGDVANTKLVVAYKSMPVGAVMDAVAALYLFRWQKTTDKQYHLLGSSVGADTVFLPKNEYQRDRFAASKAFLASLDKLPATERNRILAGSPIHALPPSLQTPVKEMIQALNRQKVAEGRNPWDMDRLRDATLRVSEESREGFRTYKFNVTLPGIRSTSFAYNDYADTKREAERANTKTGNASIGAIYSTALYAVPRREADKQAQMKKRVSLNVRDATLPQVLLMLHQKYDIPFVSQNEKELPQRADVRFDSLPLATALDRLTELYKGTDWELRRLGFVVVWGENNRPRNPTPSKTVLRQNRGQDTGSNSAAPISPSSPTSLLFPPPSKPK
jgi:cytochrome c556